MCGSQQWEGVRFQREAEPVKRQWEGFSVFSLVLNIGREQPRRPPNKAERASTFRHRRCPDYIHWEAEESRHPQTDREDCYLAGTNTRWAPHFSFKKCACILWSLAGEALRQHNKVLSDRGLLCLGVKRWQPHPPVWLCLHTSAWALCPVSLAIRNAWMYHLFITY